MIQCFDQTVPSLVKAGAHKEISKDAEMPKWLSSMCEFRCAPTIVLDLAVCWCSWDGVAGTLGVAGTEWVSAGGVGCLF